MKKLISFIAASAILLNNLIAPLSVLAQTIEPTIIPEETIEPTENPTPTPDTTLIDSWVQTPDVTNTPDETSLPTPTDLPTETQAPESGPTTPGPPEGGTTGSETLNETLIENIDLSQVSEINSNVLDSGTITTDKPDYSPGSVALISGSGFLPNKSYSIEIFADNDYFFVDHNIQADSDGNIQYLYTLDTAFHPLYTVNIKSGEVVVATMIFTDSAADIDQCSNGKVSNPNNCTAGDHAWVNGDLNANNAHYREGGSVPYRMKLTGLNENTTYTLVIGYDTRRSDAHAFDYLTTVNRAGVAAIVDPCDGANVSLANCPIPISGTLPSGVNDYPIPAPSPNAYPISLGYSGSANDSALQPITSFNSLPSNEKRFVIVDGSINSATLNGPFGALTDNTSETTVKIVFTTGTNKTSALIAWGGHIASRTDWGFLEGIPVSAGGISGSPYHMRLKGFCAGNVNDCTTGGNQDRSLKAEAVAAPSNITTAIHNTSDNVVTSVPAGSTVHDSATVVGNSPTGTVTFYWFTNGTCLNTPANTSSSFTLTNGYVDATTFAFGPLNVGSYSFKAHYSGDSNNLASDSDCEPLSVTKLNPTISTILSSSTASIGELITDSATLTGATSDAGGTVTYHAYAGANTCTGTDLLNSVVNVSNGSIPDSDEISFNNAGTYSFQALYTGDDNNNGATSICSTEQLVVSKSSPTISTTPSSGGIVGITLNDTATVSGGYNPTGSVTFKLFSPSDQTCSGAAVYTETDTTAPYATATGFTSNAVGTWHWTADYLGDTNNKPVSSACADEAVTVTKATPTLTTTASSPIIVGEKIHDTAHLSGGYGTLGGSITFDIFAPGDVNCSTATSVLPVKTISGGGDYQSGDYTTTAVGDYRWIAHYSGDDYNSAVDTACNDANETSTVNKATPTLITLQNPTEAILGAFLYDTATISGGYSPTGTVTFNLYNPNNQSCTTGTQDFQNIVNVTGAGSYTTSSGFQALVVGLWNWVASYSGDDYNNAISGNCGDEPVTINQAGTSVTTQVHNTSHVNITNTSIPLGSIVHDIATVTGQIANVQITGDVTYKFFNNGTCTGTPASSETVSVGTESSPTTALNASSYSYEATYMGDENYTGSVGVCEPFSVSKAELDISTLIHNANHQIVTSVPQDSIVHDTATVSGAIQGFSIPTVSFTFYSGSECESEGTILANIGMDEVDTNAYRSPDSSALSAGAYSYSAIVDGDSNYYGATSLCEPLTVTNPAISITKSNNSGAGITAGTTVTYTLEITNDGNVTLYGLVVTDILPGGFSYVDGSTVGAGEPVKSGATLTWSGFDPLVPQEKITINYKAATSSDLSDGIYKNYATCTSSTGETDGEPDYRQVSEPVNCEVVNSSVQIGSTLGYSGSLGGQVLGASTILPATGNPTWVLVAAIVALGTGIYLNILAKKKNVKK